MVVELLAGLLLLLLAAYKYYTWNYDYWERRGVPHLKPSFPFGNVKDVILMKKPIGEAYDKIYWELKDHPFGGFYRLQKPVLMARDPELVKKVFVEHFDCFQGNDYYVNPESDPILGLNPFNNIGEKWKKYRSIITPSLTPAKVKRMLPYMQETCTDLVAHLESCEGKYLEALDLMGKYSTDIVGSCAYGVKCNSFKDPDSEFRKMSQQMFDGSWQTQAAILFALYAPKMADIFKFKILNTQVTEFFIHLVKQISEHRMKTGEIRNDYVQTLISDNEEYMKKNDGKRLYTDTEMAAHCMTFFLDGYETVAILLSFVLFELSMDQEVQDRLRKAINKEIPNLKEATFEQVYQLEYLENVLQEGLRMHPPGTSMARLCNKDVTLTTSNGEVLVKAGTPVILPMYSIHNDPNNFKNPEKFEPDRFTDEGRKEWHPYAHFPLGGGPRSCPGYRFAFTMMKMALITIVANFKVYPMEGMERKVEYDPMNTFFHTAKDGLWLKFVKLN